MTTLTETTITISQELDSNAEFPGIVASGFQAAIGRYEHTNAGETGLPIQLGGNEMVPTVSEVDETLEFAFGSYESLLRRLAD